MQKAKREAPLRASSRRMLASALLLGLGASASGCATIVSGTTEKIRFESHPPGATVRVDGGAYETPASVELSRKRNHDVTFELDGYLPAERQVLRGTNSWLFGNILIGGLVGLAIDHSTGASNDLRPDVLTVELVADEPVEKEATEEDAAQGDATGSADAAMGDD